MTAEDDNFEQILLGAIDDSLLNLGDSCRTILYSYLAAALSLKRYQIPRSLEGFAAAMRDIFNVGGRLIEGLIIKTLCEKLDVEYANLKDMEFQAAIEEIKRRTTIL